MRRFWASVGSVLLGVPVLGLPFASAHENHGTFEWREPQADGLDVAGSSVHVKVRTKFDDGVDRWIVEAVEAPAEGGATDADGEGYGTVCEGSGDGQETVGIDCEWDTTKMPDGSIAPNQHYRLVVTVWNSTGKADKSEPQPKAGGDEPTTTTTEPGETTTTRERVPTEAPPAPDAADPSVGHAGPERRVTVANAPKPVDNVKLAYNEEHGVVSVSWARNPEPDVAGYLVEEKFESGEWVLVGKPTTLLWSAKLENPGTYRYRVAAVRKVGSDGRFKEGPFRQPQSGTTKVEHKAETDGSSTSSSSPRSSTAGEKQPSGKKDSDDDQDRSASSDTTTSSSEPVGSVTFTYEGQRPGEAGFPEPLAAPVLPEPAFSAIQPGSPGTIQTHYADPVPLPKPLTPEEAYDPGFSMSLPYPPQALIDMQPAGEIEGPPASAVAVFDSDSQQRGVLAALAGGLCAFVLSMQATFLNHRPRPSELMPASHDWD